MKPGTDPRSDGSRDTRAHRFDVSVIVPVFNTLPYLGTCLDSLAGQSIGFGRLQVIAVDDGSTDGSGEALDRFADQHPGSVVIRHQPNSGGPANPCNEGLALAEGRFVFFLGSDDYLGLDALERLVQQADEWNSDVIFGTMVGVNDRYVDQRIYRRSERDLDFVKHPLAYSLSNTKLFRRELIEKFGIRYREDMSVGEDQLFVIQAILKAKRVSVLDGEPFYFAVKRDDNSNITYTVPWRPRVKDVTAIIEGVAELVSPGELRDAILRRHFHFELGTLLKRDLPEVPQEEQEAVLAAYRGLADRFLTDRLAERLPVEHRVRGRLAQAGEIDTLRRFPTAASDVPNPHLVLRDGQAFSDLPGFGTFPVEWYQHNPRALQERIEENVEVTGLRLEGEALLVAGTTRIRVETPDQMYVALVKVGPDHASLPARRIDSKRLRSRRVHPVTLRPGPAMAESRWEVRVPLPVVPEMPDEGLDWEARLRFVVDKWTYDLPITLDAPSMRSRAREGLTWQSLRLDTQPEGYVRINQRIAARLG